MRPYRGLTKDGKWVYGSYTHVHDIDGNPSIIPIGMNTFISVLPETVGQSTGLKDKNGKEIWEGDIVKSKNKTGYIRYRVDPVSMEFEIKALTGDAWYDYMGPKWSCDELEIIGNIHQELIKESP